MTKLQHDLRRLNTEGKIRTDIENLLLREMLIQDTINIMNEELIYDTVTPDSTEEDLFSTVNDYDMTDGSFDYTINPNDIPSNLF